MTDATIHIEEVGGAALRVVVAGEIDLANATDVEKRILEAISNQLTDVTVDLRDVEYIDSAGLRVLFTLATRLATLQIGLVLLVAPESPIRRVLEVSGVTAAIPVRPG
jgi:anti-anti-sigma factor